MTGPTATGRIVVAYSLDPAHYLPLCPSCHSRFDRHPTRPVLDRKD